MRGADQPPEGGPVASAELVPDEREALLPEPPAWPTSTRSGCATASLAVLSLALGATLWGLAAVAACAPARGSAGNGERTLKQGELPPCLGQPSEDQMLKGEILRAICSHLGEEKRFLVFGNGWDSPMWLHSNPRGVVQFIEHHEHWIDIQPREVRNVSVLVNYTCSFDSAEQDVDNTDMLREFYDKQLPISVRGQQWDVILVDGPEGFGSGSPGRGQSIYAASLLAKPGASVYVNDCGRRVEELYVDRWFEQRGWQKIMHDDNGNGGQACFLFMNETQVALMTSPTSRWHHGAGVGSLGSTTAPITRWSVYIRIAVGEMSVSVAMPPSGMPPTPPKSAW